MSDISIPGISGSNDSIDTERVIEDLVRIERIPLDRLEQDGEEYRRDRIIWQDIGRTIGQLQERSRSLFSFDNPFRERIGNSSQIDAVEATASRRASEQQSDIEVQRLAGRDRFLSAKLATDYRVAPGNYRFRVGDQEGGFEFDGGTLREFAEQANDELKDLIEVKVVQSDADNLVAVFESKLSGASNQLQFLDASRRLALDTGVITERARNVHTFAPTESAAYPDVAVIDGDVTLPPGTELLLPLPQRIEPGDSSTAPALEADIRVLHTPPGTNLPANPITPSSGEITLQDITIFNIPSETLLPEQRSPIVVDDLQFLFALDGELRVPLPALTDSDDYRRQQIPLQDNAVDAIYIRNRNTNREISLRNIRIVDLNARIDGEPLHPLDNASDAELTIDGVAVTRPSNTIEDLLPGVTLQLRAPTSGPATIAVTPDWDAIQNSVIAFLGDYNQLVRDINILTRSDGELVEEITFFNEEERDRARERLGLFGGDITLNQLRQRLQRITQDAYPTDRGREVGLLAQIGISTNARGFNSGGVNQSRLRGYLEIDTAIFDAALRSDLNTVRELFGSDTDGDLIVDSGVAFELDRNLRPYIQAGGVVPSRDSSLGRRIGENETEIEDYRDRLGRYEDRLREEFGEMEAALNTLDATTESIRSLNNNNSGR